MTNFVQKCAAGALFTVLILPAPTVMAAQAGMGPGCQALYEKYSAGNGPRAFARGKTKGCGWKETGGTISLAEARKRAVAFCTANGGDRCAVVESVR